MPNKPETVKSILQSARELIADPAHWTQSAFARDVNGNDCVSNDPEAVCFCALGALNKAANYYDSKKNATLYFKAKAALRDMIYPHNISMFNDRFDRTHAEILRLFDDAIAKAEE